MEMNVAISEADQNGLKVTATTSPSTFPISTVSDIITTLPLSIPNGNGNVDAVTEPILPIKLGRKSFPHGFVFGAAASAYQIEGAAREGGRGPSIWDTFAHKFPGKIADGSNGDLAVDFYHQYKEDIKIMKKMGFDAFRFSISWTRVLPSGKIDGGVNKEGIKFYNDLIDEVLANGMKPFVTLFHWDLPQALEDEYGGFLSSRIVNDFADYVDLCFWEFGDRVKHWVTLNEPYMFSYGGYADGTFPPGRGASSVKPITSTSHFMYKSCGVAPQSCDKGDPGTEPYIVTHNLILAHARAVQLYRQKYEGCQKGQIGIVLVVHWMKPYDEHKSEDRQAAQRALDFMFGWFMEPLTTGDYPHSMQKLVGRRLPEFSREQSHMVKGSFDFLGLNYYTGRYVAPCSTPPVDPDYNYGNHTFSIVTDPKVTYFTERNGIPIGPLAPGSPWLNIYPEGLYNLLVYTMNKYCNPVIYITENGVDEKNDPKLTLKIALDDHKIRERFHKDHLFMLRRAMKEHGVNVKGYIMWALMDNYEWASGYQSRFGLIYVDYKDGKLTRYPKESAKWFMDFLTRDDKEIAVPPIISVHKEES